jgi:hypothetical protein
MSFRLFFGGAEEPGWRRILVDNGARHIALSYRHLHRRLPKTKPWRLVEQVPPGVEVFLDSAAFNAKDDERQHALDLYPAWRDFVEANLDALTLFSEFDALPEDEGWLRARREEMAALGGRKFMPVWHAAQGLDTLRHLAQDYDHVGVPRAAITPPVTAAVRSLSGATHFHAIGEADPDVLTKGFGSASTHSWLSATKYGETIVWTGNALKRYPSKMKDQARRRHRMLMERAGFDAEAIAKDDGDELARFTIWSFLRLEEHIAAHRLVTGPASNGHGALAETTSGPVDGLHPARRNGRIPLPVLTQDADKVPQVAAGPIRRCSSCHVAGSCPAAQFDAECAFDIPVEVKTKEQLLGLLRGVIEIQSQRVAFARYAEELDGGYPDPNLSNEIDRLMRVILQAKDIQDDRDFLTISVAAHAGAGVLSRIFGARETAPVTTLSRQLTPGETDHLVATVIEAEPVAESPNTNGHPPGGNGA